MQDSENTYDQAITKLNEHFNIKKNIPYERSVFREAKQETNESLDQFITRLRKLTTYCEYGNNVNDEIRDEVIHTCKSTKLQTRLLQEQDLTLEKVENIGRIMKQSTKQSKNIEEPLHEANADIDEVNKIVKQPYKSKNRYKSQDYKKAYKQPHSKEKTCTRCGKQGHLSHNCKCMQGKKCLKCGKLGHFAKCCKTNLKSIVPRNSIVWKYGT